MNFVNLEQKAVYEFLIKSLQSDNGEVNFDISELGGDKDLLESLWKDTNELKNRHQISYYWPLFSARKYLGKIIVFCQKVVRRLLKYLLFNIVNQVSDFNDIVSRSIGNIFLLEKEHSLKIGCFEEKLETQNQMVTSNINMLTSQERNINEVNEKVQNYRDSMDTIEQKQDLQDKKFESIESRLTKIEDVYQDAILDIGKLSYSQSGEDSIIAYILFVLGIDIKTITYMDLGANHSKILSNTYFLYKKGARGLLIEANPYLIGELLKDRAGDKILNRIVSDTSGNIKNIHIISGDGLSTVNLNSAESILKENEGLSIVQTVEVETISYNEAVNELGKTPDLLNIDLEGYEMEVLKAADLNKYRPFLIIIESIPYRKHLVVGERDMTAVDYLKTQGYVEYAFTGINSIMIDAHNDKIKEIYAV
ncbi:FkbM family methyltransferase [Lachnospiraceae bacterium 54-53]